MKLYLIPCMLLLFWLPAVWAGEGGGESLQLTRDPFQRPSHSAIKKTPDEDVVKGTAALQLLATMNAKPVGMANVNNVLLQPGDEINGYRLVAVRDFEVVFEKNGIEVVVSMNRE